MSKTVTSLQIKVHECYVKLLEPRKSLLSFEDEGWEDVTDEQSDVEELTEILEDATLSDKED